MSTVYHPQSDGHMERIYQVLESYLLSYCNYTQNDWASMLAMAEYAYNNSKRSSAKNISVWADWLRQSGRAPSEPSETPRWQITPRPAPIPRAELHIALRSPFCRFFSLCRPPTLHKHSGVVANCDHTSEWVHCVHASIGIAMHKNQRNCTDSRNLAKSE